MEVMARTLCPPANRISCDKEVVHLQFEAWAHHTNRRGTDGSPLLQVFCHEFFPYWCEAKPDVAAASFSDRDDRGLFMSVALRSFHKPVRLRLAVLAVHSYFDANADDNPTTTYSTMRTHSLS